MKSHQIELVDKLARAFPDRVNLPKLQQNLLEACPAELKTTKGGISKVWKKAVHKYIGELYRVKEWNEISKQM